MVATSSAVVLECLQQYLSILQELESHLVKQRKLMVGDIIREAVGDDVPAIALAPLDNPSRSVKAEVGILGLSPMGELIDSIDCVDEPCETTDIPHFVSLIVRILVYPRTMPKYSATDVIRELCGIQLIFVGVDNLAFNKWFYADMVGAPWAPNESLDSVESDGMVDQSWDTSDIPLLESIIALLIGSHPTDTPSPIEDIICFRSTIVRLVKHPSTLGKSLDTDCTTDAKSVPTGTTECCSHLEKSTHSTDCDTSFNELWGINDMPHLVSVTVRMIESQSTLDELTTTGDIVYFESIIIGLIERRASPAEVSESTAHVADANSAITYIMGSEGTLDDGDDMGYFQSIVPRIIESRGNPDESIDATDHNAGLVSEIALVQEFLVMFQKCEITVNSPDEIRNYHRMSAYDGIGGIAQLEWDITRMEQLNAAVRSLERKAVLTMYLLWLVYERYNRFGDVQDVELVIQGTEMLLSNSSFNRQFQRFVLRWLVSIYEDRFLRLRNIQDIDRAIQLGEVAVAATPHDDPVRADILGRLAERYRLRYNSTSNIKDSKRAIELLEEAIKAPTDNTPWHVMMWKLGRIYASRFQSLGKVEDIDRAIQLCEAAVAATPHDLVRVDILGSLAESYRLRYNSTSNIKDNKRAIELLEEAIKATPPQSPETARKTMCLGYSYASWFSRLGKMHDIDRAIQLGEAAMSAIPRSARGYSKMVHYLAMYYDQRFDRFGAVDDLDRAIQNWGAAVAATPRGCQDLVGLLNGFSCRLNQRLSRSHSRADFEKAVKAAGESLAAAPLVDPSRVGMSSNIGFSYYLRFIKSSGLAYLDGCIRASEEALENLAPGHILRPTILRNLGTSLAARYQLSLDPADNDRALKLQEEAVAETPLDHPDRAGRLASLSLRLVPVPSMVQAVLLVTVIVLCACAVADEIGISFMEVNLMTAPRKHLIPDLYFILTLAQRIMATMFGRGPRGINQDELLDIEEQLDSRCRESEFLAEVRSNVERQVDKDAPMLRRKAKLHRGVPVSNLDRSQEMLLAAWNCQNSPPKDRIKAAWSAGMFLAFSRRWEEASKLLYDAVQILPQLTPRFLARDDQEYMLSTFTELASDAVAMALQAGATPSHCLNILELGRGIIMGLAINCRSDVSELQIKYPDICHRFNRLRNDIDSPIIGKDVDHQDQEGRRRRRVQAMKEIDEILISIRELPDFGGFQLSPRPKDLIALAANGPIIIFNTTKLRSDAIIVTGSIKSVPLPKMHYPEIQARMKELPGLVRGKRSTWRARNDKMTEILLWLWEVSVEPVLEEVGPDISRVWWIGVGPLATAPFHAAGDHSRGSTRNTISRVISSYIPTVKSLMYATQKKLDLNSEDTRLLLVTMPTTPGGPAIPVTSVSNLTPESAASQPPAKTWKPLQNVATEASEIMDAVNGTRITRLDCPTTTQVLESIPAHNVIHFACHGVSDRENPSGSHLVLCSDNPSETGKLTVGTISNMNIQNAQVAYLSACSSALNRSKKLADESIHIASGFQLAGFSHVLGTLWSSDDNASRLVAGEFYRILFNGKVDGHRAVSHAFHQSVLKLRNDLWNQPIKWAPFIHTGA